MPTHLVESIVDRRSNGCTTYVIGRVVRRIAVEYLPLAYIIWWSPRRPVGYLVMVVMPVAVFIVG